MEVEPDGRDTHEYPHARTRHYEGNRPNTHFHDKV